MYYVGRYIGNNYLYRGIYNLLCYYEIQIEV